MIDLRWNGSYWEYPIELGGWIEGNLDAVSTYMNRIFVFARAGQTGYVNQFEGNSWSGWQSLGAAVVSDTAAVSASNPLQSYIYVAHRGTDDRLYINGWNSETRTWSGWAGNGGSALIRPTLTSSWHRMLVIDVAMGRSSSRLRRRPPGNPHYQVNGTFGQYDTAANSRRIVMGLKVNF